MARSNDAWGIEVGANALKAVRLVNDGDEVRVSDFEVIPFKTILTTPDLNVDLEVQSILDQFMMRHEVSKSHVVVSVPGNLAFARFAKLPPVEPKKIPDIVKFEAQQQIPFPIDQVEWDYQVFVQDDSPDVDVGIFAIAKERVLTFLSNYEERNLKIDTLTLSPVAVYNAMAYEMGLENETTATIIMDIGTTSTDLVIVDQGRVWLRTMQIGGNNFTEALVKSFKLSFPKAEKLKREAGTSKYARQIFQAMRPVFNDLVQETQKSLGFYQATNREAELGKLIGLGSTFRLPGLSKFLKQQLALDVIRPEKYQKLTIDGKRSAEFAEAALNMGTAYGLALQGLGLAPIEANIMPEHIVRQRLWKAKQPWVAAAAAVVLVATIAAYFNFSSVKSSYAAEVQDTDGKVNPVLAQAKKMVVDMKDSVKESDPRTRIENLNRILDYRDVWPKVIEDLGMATMALKPQDVLISGTVDEQKLIPREQRKRVYIKTVDAQYVVSTPVADAAKAGRTELGAYDVSNRVGADEINWGDSTPAPAPAPTPGATGTTPAPAADVNKPEPPSFVITIRGTTPYQFENKTAGFLSKHFLEWLRVNFKRTNRPYAIVTDDIKLVSLEKITEDDIVAEASNTSGVTPNRGARPNGPEVGIRPGVRPGVRPTPVRPGIRPGIRPTNPTPNNNTDETQPEGPIDPMDILYPVKPEEKKIQAGDYKFEITWTIRLLRPEATRQGGNQDGKAGDENKSDSTTPPGKQANGEPVPAKTDKQDAEVRS